MRTTLELPEPLFQKAKLAALQRKVTLKTLITQALSRELDLMPSSSRRMTAPPVKAAGGRTIPAMTNKEMQELLAEEDVLKTR